MASPGSHPTRSPLSHSLSLLPSLQKPHRAASPVSPLLLSPLSPHQINNIRHPHLRPISPLSRSSNAPSCIPSPSAHPISLLPSLSDHSAPYCLLFGHPIFDSLLPPLQAPDLRFPASSSSAPAASSLSTRSPAPCFLLSGSYCLLSGRTRSPAPCSLLSGHPISGSLLNPLRAPDLQLPATSAPPATQSSALAASTPLARSPLSHTHLMHPAASLLPSPIVCNLGNFSEDFSFC